MDQAAMNKVEELMAASDKWMKQLGFSEKRIEVALQKGGLRRLMEKVCDESLSVPERGLAYMAAESGISAIACMDDSAIEEVLRRWAETEDVEKPDGE